MIKSMVDHPDYEILGLIGEGSFGRVFKARERCGERRTVALKVIPKVGKSEKDVASLRVELKIQESLRSHPNVVRMLSAFETDQELAAVTEFVAGGDLHSLTKSSSSSNRRRRTLPEGKVRSVACDVLSALHFLHSNRILHRDVKPQNILIDKEGRAKLCDFGFARHMAEQTLVLTSVKGTPLYMAPEVMEGKPYDEKVDLWSVGCILYELCVGATPFHSGDLAKLISNVRHDSVRWPQEESMSSECRDFLQMLLEKDPRRRADWAAVTSHPFVEEHFRTNPPERPNSSCTSPLTDPLTESRELAKEMQRQDKAARLAQSSSASMQPLAALAQKQQEERMNRRTRGETNFDQFLPPPFPFPAPPPLAPPPPPPAMLPLGPAAAYAASAAAAARRNSSACILPAAALPPPPPGEVARRRHSDMGVAHGSAGGAVEVPPKPSLEEKKTAPPVRPPSPEDILSDTCDPLNSEEWGGFLQEQMADERAMLDSMGNQNYVAMLVKPLRNVNISRSAASKVATALSTPFVQDGETGDHDHKKISSAIGALGRAKALTHVLVAIRRFARDESNEEEEEDGDLELLAAVVTRLAYSSSDFADELCDALGRIGLDLLPSILKTGEDPSVRCHGLSWMLRASTRRPALGSRLAGRCLTTEVVDVILKDEDFSSVGGPSPSARRLLSLLCQWKKSSSTTTPPEALLKIARRLKTNNQLMEAGVRGVPENLQEALKKLLQD